MNEVERLFRIGQVSSINDKNGAVRIAYDDMTDGTDEPYVSGEMQILQRNTGLVKHNSQSAVGEHVVTLQLPNGPQEGFILGSLFTAENMQDVADPGVEKAIYPDGTIIEYDSNSSEYTIIGTSCHIIIKVKDADVTLDEFAKVKAKDIEVTAETAKVTAQTAELTADTATITASTVSITGAVTINGDLSVSGSINASGSILAAGANSNHHTH
ncbi:baseplate protein [Clostridia bacterium]|nr:baseplate protein [Clostridia bacterium]